MLSSSSSNMPVENYGHLLVLSFGNMLSMLVQMFFLPLQNLMWIRSYHFTSNGLRGNKSTMLLINPGRSYWKT